MKKREVILGIAIVLIIALAIVVGINLSKSKSEPTSAEPSSNPKVNMTNTPSFGTDDPNSESPSPEPDETASPEATQTPSPAPQNKDISQMTEKQKEDYAKSIVKLNWEGIGIEQKVFYTCDSSRNSETYRITVRDEETTRELIRYEVNIKTGSCEEI